MDAADFAAARHETLTHRMRSAKRTGQVPMWGVAETAPDAPDAPDAPQASPSLTRLLHGDAPTSPPHEEEEAGDATSAPPPSSGDASAQLLLTLGVVASIVGVGVLIAMSMHRGKYHAYEDK